MGNMRIFIALLLLLLLAFMISGCDSGDVKVSKTPGDNDNAQTAGSSSGDGAQKQQGTLIPPKLPDN